MTYEAVEGKKQSVSRCPNTMIFSKRRRTRTIKDTHTNLNFRQITRQNASTLTTYFFIIYRNSTTTTYLLVFSACKVHNLCFLNDAVTDYLMLGFQLTSTSIFRSHRSDQSLGTNHNVKFRIIEFVKCGLFTFQ